MSKIRVVKQLLPLTEEVIVTSRSKKLRKRKDPTGRLLPNDFCEVKGDEAYPLQGDGDGPKILVVQG